MSTHDSDKPEKPKIERAVALKYEGGRSAPRVVAKGEGLLAEKIIALAEEHDVPLYEDPDLLMLLAEVGLDETIPEALYKAVAEVLAFVYSINNSFPATDKNNR